MRCAANPGHLKPQHDRCCFCGEHQANKRKHGRAIERDRCHGAGATIEMIAHCRGDNKERILQEMSEMPYRDVAQELTHRNIPTPRGVYDAGG